MSNIIFSSMIADNEPFYGKFVHPIKALIENESNILEKEKDILSAIYNIEKSNRYAETTIGETGFGNFKPKAEGAGAENDSVGGGFNKTIYHIPFAKEFTITREMMADAKFGFPADMKRIPRAFTRSYYQTKNDVGTDALVNAYNTAYRIEGESVDLTVGDGKALFHKGHTFKKNGGSQSNYFRSADMCGSAAECQVSLKKLAVRMRNFKDENGRELGYVPDTIILPGNRPALEDYIQTAVGTERRAGSNNNDINTQYGGYNVIVIPRWQPSDDRFILMSSKANEELGANMFYNREALDLTSEVDGHTRSMIWNGYCRFGVGFTNWKHIIMAVDAASGDSMEALT